MRLKPLPLRLSQKQRDYLWGRVNKGHPAECWLWTGRLSSSQYPLASIKDIAYCATRLAYLDYWGEDPGNLLVCHTCDTPTCMNPNHFFLGTSQANTADKVKKDRQARGAQVRRSSLTEMDVRNILLLEGKESSTAIGRRFGVSKSSIKHIFQGRNWSHVTGRHYKCTSSD